MKVFHQGEGGFDIYIEVLNFFASCPPFFFYLFFFLVNLGLGE